MSDRGRQRSAVSGVVVLDLVFLALTLVVIGSLSALAKGVEKL
ncbi:hypothetical protein [Litorihabitans aurantiacus]|nr:hypothetical protein [Litorihabitans aurantiacus]